MTTQHQKHKRKVRSSELVDRVKNEGYIFQLDQLLEAFKIYRSVLS